MKIFLKCGASALAILAAISLAQAQTNEREKVAPGAEREQAKPSQGSPAKGSEQHQTAPKGSEQHKTAPKGHAEGATQQPGRTTAEESKGQNRQKQSEVTGAAKGEPAGRAENERSKTRVNINVTTQQKTRIHDFIAHDNGIRRYHRSDINFSLNVGTRIPDAITYYDPPSQFLEIDPEFSGYKIVVLDDVILIIDPETREIIDVIET
jgi:hypothetical protein